MVAHPRMAPRRARITLNLLRFSPFWLRRCEQFLAARSVRWYDASFGTNPRPESDSPQDVSANLFPNFLHDNPLKKLIPRKYGFGKIWNRGQEIASDHGTPSAVPPEPLTLRHRTQA